MKRRVSTAAVVSALAVAGAVGVLSASADPNRQGEHLVSVKWQRNREKPSTGKTLHLIYHYRGYACQYRFHGAGAKETENRVTVRVRAHWRAMRPGEACSLEVGGGRADLKLERPLGDRELRHAKVTDPGATD